MLQIQDMIISTFGTVGYLRNLFPENNFEDVNVAGLSLKKIKKGISAEADTVLDWIEQGVFDALEKKYLETLAFGISLNAENPFVNINYIRIG